MGSQPRGAAFAARARSGIVLSRRKYAADATGVEHPSAALDPVAPAREAYVHDDQSDARNSQPDRLFRGICGPHHLKPGFESAFELQSDETVISTIRILGSSPFFPPARRSSVKANGLRAGATDG